MSDAGKMFNIELNSRDAQGEICDTDNMDISEASASAIIDKASDLMLVFQACKGRSAQEFYDKAFNKMDDLNQELIEAGILSSD